MDPDPAKCSGSDPILCLSFLGFQLCLPATSQEGHNAQHLSGGAQLQDGEEVGQVVTQHIARHADGVLSCPGTPRVKKS